MIRRVTRLVAGLTFAVMGFVSLVVADVASQWLCTRVFACDAALNCPIDVCEGDARLTFLRLAVWLGPAIVFGASAIAFSGRRRSLPAWLGLLAALMAAHSLIMAAFR